MCRGSCFNTKHEGEKTRSERSGFFYDQPVIVDTCFLPPPNDPDAYFV